MWVALTPEVVGRLRGALRVAGRREIGGILLAEQLEPGQFMVVDFSVAWNAGSRMAFTREPAMHRDAMDTFVVRTGEDCARFNYLGEWHSHPSFKVQPSAEDLATMEDLVKGGGRDLTFAVLLIVRLRYQLWLDYSLTLFARGYAPWDIRARRPLM